MPHYPNENKKTGHMSKWLVSHTHGEKCVAWLCGTEGLCAAHSPCVKASAAEGRESLRLCLPSLTHCFAPPSLTHCFAPRHSSPSHASLFQLLHMSALPLSLGIVTSANTSSRIPWDGAARSAALQFPQLKGTGAAVACP